VDQAGVAHMRSIYEVEMVRPLSPLELKEMAERVPSKRACAPKAARKPSARKAAPKRGKGRAKRR
jgi:hypothetical protein